MGMSRLSSHGRIHWGERLKWCKQLVTLLEVRKKANEKHIFTNQKPAKYHSHLSLVERMHGLQGPSSRRRGLPHLWKRDIGDNDSIYFLMTTLTLRAPPVPAVRRLDRPLPARRRGRLQDPRVQWAHGGRPETHCGCCYAEQSVEENRRLSRK